MILACSVSGSSACFVSSPCKTVLNFSSFHFCPSLFSPCQIDVVDSCLLTPAFFPCPHTFSSLFCFFSKIIFFFFYLGFQSVQFSRSVPWLFATPWTTARQASLSIINSRSWLKLMFIESVMPSKHLILCCPLLLPSIFPSIKVFSSESAL